jgi:hypothetical protein
MHSLNDLGKEAVGLLKSVPPALFGADYGIRMQLVRYNVCEPVEVPVKKFKGIIGEEKQIVHLLDNEGHYKVIILKPSSQPEVFLI